MTATFLNSVTAEAYPTGLGIPCSVGDTTGSTTRQAPSVNSGIDISALDAGIRPADDLFRHLNGTWLATAEIPADRATAGSFMDLFDEAETKVRAIVESSAADPQDDEQRKIGDLYTSFMDVDRTEALGSEPLRADLALVDKVTDISGLVATLGAIERSGVAGMFGMYVSPDKGNPDRYLLTLVQGGIGLPDESYYRGDQFAEIRSSYVRHIERMLGLAGIDDAAARAQRIVAHETKIAAAHWDRVECRDAQKTYNLLSRDNLDALATGFDWSTWANGAQVDAGAFDEVVVSQPSYFESLDALLTVEHLDGWLDWLRWQIVHAAAPYLSSPFVDENFDFYGRTLSGTAELRERWKRGVAFVEGTMGEAVGRIYVAENYPEAAKHRMDELIANLVEAYRQSISDLTWMSDQTKARALEKLGQFTPKVGHPEEWRDYSVLETTADDLLGNVKSGLTFGMERELAKLGGPIDRGEWFMTPQTVNAYYNPTMNEIVFPAAILRPPFFYADADDAANYGAIGAVIGHEIGHGFDDQGSQFDGTGALRDWWTDTDRAEFEKLTARLIGQYDNLSPDGADGQSVNGSLTIGENIGDLGGLSIALRAYWLALGETQAPVIDGLSGEQRFFFSWAQTWQAKVREQEVIRRLTVDPHSPPEFRCNQVVRNIDAFYEAFDVNEFDGLWLDPAERVKIW